MNKKNNIIITILIMIAMIEISSATSYDYISYRSVYGEGTCATCHVSASGNSIMNDYGNLFKNQINYINDPIASLKNIGRNLNSPINDPRITCIGEGVDIKCTFDSTPPPISMKTPRLYIDIINSQLTPDIATVINGTILVFTNKDNIINEIKGTLPMKNGIGGFDAILSVPYIINTNDITGTMDVYIVNKPNIHGKYTIVQSTGSAVVTSITISPSTATLTAGATTIFTAATLDQNGTAINATVTWNSSNTNVGTISSAGVFTAVTAGTTTITATSGTVSGTATATVTVINPSAGTVTRSFSAANVAPGTSITVTLTPGGAVATGFFQVFETLPAGFTFGNSSVGSSQAGQVVTFTTLGGSAFTYTVTAPMTIGLFTFNGTFKNVNLDTGNVGGSSVILAGTQSSGTVTRSKSPVTVLLDGILTITLTPSPNNIFSSPGYQVIEIIPAEFTYISTTAVGSIQGNVITLTQLGSSPITYTLRAPSFTGSYAISGTFKDQISNIGIVSDSTNIRVGAGYDANGDGRIDRNEAIQAVIDYFAGDITRQDAIDIVILYFSQGSALPVISFTNPTPADGATLSQNYIYSNTTISDASTAFIDWNHSLAGWWRLNGESGENPSFFKDWSSWGNNATCSGTNCPASTSGKFGNALSFDGTTNYMDAGNAASLDLTGAITIEAWINPAVSQEKCHDGVSGNYGVMSKASAPANSSNWSWQLRYGAPGNGCYLGFNFNGNPEDSRWVTIKQNLTPSQWYYIVGTFDGTDIKSYLDGNLKDTNKITTIRGYPNKLLIGNDGWGNYFNGKIDEVRIHKRALSPEEIKASYDAGINRLYRNFTDLAVGSYNYQAYAQDLAGNVNHTETRSLTLRS